MFRMFSSRAMMAFALVVAVASVTAHSTALAAGSHDGIEVLTPSSFNTSLVHQSWHVLGSRPSIELFINQPRHNQPAGTYDLASLPLQYRVQYGVCNNAPSAARVIGRFDQTGGVCRTSFDNSANWSVVHNQTYNNQSPIAGTNVGGYWLSEGTFNGTVNISSLPANADKTTFQLYAIWAPDAGHLNVYGLDHQLQYQRIHGVNICINRASAPVCGNGIKEGAEQCDDGNQNNADACNNQCQTVQQQTDVKLEKIVFNPSVTKKGTRVTFILRATNLGSIAADGARIVDNIPSGLTFDTNPQQSSPFCTAAGTQITCAIGSLAAGATKDAVVSFLIPASYQPGVCPASVTNTATFYTTTPEANLQNNTASATQGVPCEPVCGNNIVEQGEKCDDGNLNNGDSCTSRCDIPYSLEVSKTVAATVTRGGQAVYTITIKNKDTRTAEDVIVVDAFIDASKNYILPPFTYVSASGATCSYQGNASPRFHCTVGDIAPGATKVITLTFNVPANAPCGRIVVNSADVPGIAWKMAQTTVQCPVLPNCGNGTVETGEQCDDGNQNNADLCNASCQKTSCQDGIKQTPNGNGQNEQCDDGNNVNTDSCNNLCQTVTQPNCGNGTVETGEQCDDGNQNNADLCNASCKKTSCQDGIKQTPNGNGVYEQCDDGNNVNTDSCSNACTLPNEPILDIEKDDFVTLVSHNQTVTYQITARNTSNVSATTVTVVDVLPSKMTFSSASDSGSHNNGTVTWNLGTLAAGATRTLTLSATVNSSANANEQLTNFIDIRLNNIVKDTDTDVDTVRGDSVCSGSSCDFSISKTDGESEVKPGDELEYEITVKNLSNQTVTNVTVYDDLPSDVDFDDCSHNCVHSGRSVRWENITFGPNEKKVFTVEVTVDEDADDGDELRNEARVFNKVAYDTTDIEEDNKKNSNDDLEAKLTKTTSTSEVFPGGIIEYTVTVENTGDTDLENLTVIDRLPSGITVLDDGNADKQTGNSSLEWNIDQLDEGDDWTVRYTVVADIGAFPGTALINEVKLTDEDDEINERASTTVYVIGDLPQTGKANRSRYGSSNLSPISSSSASSAGAAVAWISIVTTLAGAGFTAYKKFHV